MVREMVAGGWVPCSRTPREQSQSHDLMLSWKALLRKLLSTTSRNTSKVDASPPPLSHPFLPPNSQTWHWSRKLLILIKFLAIKGLNLIFFCMFRSQILCILSPKCFHTFHFPFIATVTIQRNITFLWDYTGPVPTTFPLTLNILRKVLLEPSFPLKWWFCVMLGTDENHLGWTVHAGVGGAGGGGDTHSQINWAFRSTHYWHSLMGSFSLRSHYDNYCCKNVWCW